jgi:hypothetical protein
VDVKPVAFIARYAIICETLHLKRRFIVARDFTFLEPLD